MVGWHHLLNGHEFEQDPGIGDGQGSLVCCSPWGCKESDMTEDWTELNKKNILLIHTSMWGNFKITVLKKPDRRRYTLVDSTYLTFSYKRQNYRDRNLLSNCWGVGIGEGDILPRECFFWSNRVVQYLDHGHGYTTGGIYQNLSNCTV